jgi:glycosyltransferase involved in cell wall biosynthesis
MFFRRPRPGNFSIERVYQDIAENLPQQMRVKRFENRYFSNGFIPRFLDAWAARRHQSDVNHVTGDVHFLTFFLDPKRTVLTIHDCRNLENKTGLRWFFLWLLWYRIPIWRSRFVVSISNEAQRVLLRNVSCPDRKLRIINNPVSEEFYFVNKEFNQRLPRILVVGTGENKNIARYADALKGIDCELSLIGALSESQNESLAENGIRYFSRANLLREELVSEYRAADLLLFASTYEGFGMPIIEAQAVGLPVITSSISAMPEIAGRGACLVNPFDVESIRNGVIKVMSDHVYRSQIVVAGLDNVKRFRLRTIAGLYASLYNEVYSER